ncbi:MAG: nucleotidyltransferase substrate binding protein [Bacteroidota bacterium]|jgi:nucleotidyltransferase substrate binding protein (TIGR01987 family)|nr:nucleotidyltransferase [Ignavibacteria bacterium]MCU7521344.1 nucleotidyltransferase [Ignavibacteria bacterium]MCU7524210.1 nucleotidyltransferase [Ignavibacteria bacterium]
MEKDIRWQQRFSNYKKALSQLEKFIIHGNLNELEKQGLVKAFEYTYELAWNTLKDFYESQGEAGLQGSRDAIQLAFNRGLIINGTDWMQMLKDRNRTAHIYNLQIADEITENILKKYFTLLTSLKNEFDKIMKKENGSHPPKRISNYYSSAGL